ncbi:hypothetical protein J7I84_10955 [Arthrobacter sp. ISL-85]|uniref:hypothetical protein n=1 Tax=Arthrobacter sp. ISL-85 TaxID=2819115 RepID=UPI001BE99F85|nr:hypothetical protein [Arthrobacter sp. ISL-85]MBT2567000.1 hypothetical protein [Arthrobacter sp. ISL-85]
MTNNIHPAAPHTTPALREDRTGIEDLDLTPEGLAGTPAHQEDPDSIVHTGNS